MTDAVKKPEPNCQANGCAAALPVTARPRPSASCATAVELSPQGARGYVPAGRAGQVLRPTVADPARRAPRQCPQTACHRSASKPVQLDIHGGVRAARTTTEAGHSLARTGNGPCHGILSRTVRPIFGRARCSAVRSISRRPTHGAAVQLSRRIGLGTASGRVLVHGRQDAGSRGPRTP